MDERPLSDAGWHRDPDVPQQVRWRDGHLSTGYARAVPGTVPVPVTTAPFLWPKFDPRRYPAISGVSTLLAAVGLVGAATVDLIAVVTGGPIPGFVWLAIPAFLVMVALQLWVIGLQNRLERPSRFGFRGPGWRDWLGGLSRTVKVVLVALLVGGELGALVSCYAIRDPFTPVGAERLGATVAILFFTFDIVVCCAEWLRCRAALRRSRDVT